jgi:hypothetical protein
MATLAGGAACAIVGYLALHSLTTPTKSPARLAEKAPVGPKEAPNPAGSHVVTDRGASCEFEKGELISYRLEMSEKSTIDMSGLGFGAGAAEPMEVSQSTRVTLDVEALDDTADGQTLLLGKFRDLESTALNDADRLEPPFLLRLTDKCDIEGYAYSQNTRLPYARVQQSMLYELQWRWPATRNEPFNSRNSLGTYQARLATAEQNGTPRVLRRTVKYSPWHQGPGATTRVDSSLLTVVPGHGPWFESLKLDENVAGEQSTTHRTVVATRVAAPADKLAHVAIDESNYVWADLLPSSLPLPERQPPTRQRLAAVDRARKLTVEQAVDAYVARVQDEKVGIQDTWPPLRNYLEAHPEKTETIVNDLKRQNIPAEATMGVYIALGNTQTTQAKDALTDIMRDGNAPVFERARAILSLIDRDDVGPDLAHYLSDRAASIESGESRATRIMARQSMLALGALAGRHPGNPQFKDVAVARIQETLPTVQMPLNKRPIYGAIANIGDPSLLSLVAHIPDEKDARTREYAAIVVRRMAPEKTGEFAARWLEKETNWSVKRALYKTIELQTFDARKDPSRAVLRQAVADLETIPGPITRKALIRLLARAKDRMKKNHVKDDLGIEDAFLKLIPHELERDSGMYLMLAERIDDTRRLDRATVNAIEAMNQEPGAPARTSNPHQESSSQTQPANPASLTQGNVQ